MKYSLSQHTAQITVAEYINEYRDVEKFLSFCKNCKRFGNCWSCPPFDYDTDEILQAYDYAYIIGTKILLSKELISDPSNPKDGWEIVSQILREVRLKLDEKLLALESQNPNTQVFFAGTCHFCDVDTCTRIEGKPCRHPEKIRSSLESFGFDIGKTTSDLLGIELQWSKDGSLPEYLVLVSGVLSKHAIEHLTSFSI